MIKKFEISHCHCGKAPCIYKDYIENDFYIVCDCGEKTHACSHIEDCICEWNEINKPKKAKVKYTCGNCGAELTLGFDVCTKCGLEIIW